MRQHNCIAAPAIAGAVVVEPRMKVQTNTNQNAYALAVDTVRAAFPAAGLLSLPEAAHFMGLAVKTARNMLSERRFPLSTISVGDRRLVPVPALVDWYAKQLDAAGVVAGAPHSATQQTDEAPAVKRGPGRPRKQQKGGV